jgi:hypothetical protein
MNHDVINPLLVSGGEYYLAWALRSLQLIQYILLYGLELHIANPFQIFALGSLNYSLQ